MQFNTIPKYIQLNTSNCVCFVTFYYLQKMYSGFYEFYKSMGTNGGKPLAWKKLEGFLKINEKNYPTNTKIKDYYSQTFENNTSCFGRSKWHNMDKLLYVWVVIKYSDAHEKNPLALTKADFQIFSEILNVKSNLLEFKWLKLVKPYIRNIPWSQKQDKMILELMNGELKKKWTGIALKLFQLKISQILRTAKQVRQRWVNYLDPEMKRQNWDDQEDENLLYNVEKYGKKWSELGKILKRTENSIKNRYHSLMSKISRSSQNQTSEQQNEQKEEFLKEQYIEKDNKISKTPQIAGIRQFNIDQIRCKFRQIDYSRS